MYFWLSKSSWITSFLALFYLTVILIGNETLQLWYKWEIVKLRLCDFDNDDKDYDDDANTSINRMLSDYLYFVPSVVLRL